MNERIRDARQGRVAVLVFDLYNLDSFRHQAASRGILAISCALIPESSSVFIFLQMVSARVLDETPGSQCGWLVNHLFANDDLVNLAIRPDRHGLGIRSSAQFTQIDFHTLLQHRLDDGIRALV